MDHLTFPSDADGLVLHGYHWPAPGPRATVQVVHGLSEHAPRYDRLARALVAAGYDVWAHDHRGHGASVDERTPHVSFGVGGWDGLVADVTQFSALVEAERPGLPHFLVAHSMGSFATQVTLLDHSRRYDGVVLSGSTTIDVFAAGLPAPQEGQGGDLSAFNAGFEPRTGYEWLSRDAAEVDAYVADPLCGQETAPEVMGALFSSPRVGDPRELAGIDPGLPLLVVSGGDDPLAGGGELIELLGRRYREAGVRDVEVEVYPGARHEVFNETNRDEVTRRVVDWLDARSAAPRERG
ncbi:alpha/beta fold hydrolase [Kineococcus rhizosphaerae]|uniref:Alpha-beta hydrolase superfamily lysophospholipase n=1 Tax=Kineococcus rhizosphaerae TaxID=559628 RepID=A0A2T0QZW7_9ACTN|nr:alpha/beta hydrolase [Kineococcus rhizosphaerae]PRY12220.1 alpha-beta hydrolase superfamily lysophospholipase [Kineococcus rhizosphaerae]